MMYLSHESRTMVVFALSILASLCRHEQLGEKVIIQLMLTDSFRAYFLQQDPEICHRLCF